MNWYAYSRTRWRKKPAWKPSNQTTPRARSNKKHMYLNDCSIDRTVVNDKRLLDRKLHSFCYSSMPQWYEHLDIYIRNPTTLPVSNTVHTYRMMGVKICIDPVRLHHYLLSPPTGALSSFYLQRGDVFVFLTKNWYFSYGLWILGLKIFK